MVIAKQAVKRFLNNIQRYSCVSRDALRFKAEKEDTVCILFSSICGLIDILITDEAVVAFLQRSFASWHYILLV